MIDKYRREAPKTDRWVPGTPDPETIQENTYSTPLPGGGLIIVKFEQDSRDRILGFAVVHLDWCGDLREQVAKVDTRHEEIHLHVYGHANRQLKRDVLRIIRSGHDVEEGYDEALAEITEKWEEHRRRWRDGH